MDWGRSRLGDPLTDLTFSCMAHCLPQDNPLLTGTIIPPNCTTAPYQAHGYKTQMAPYSHAPWSKVVQYIGCHLGYNLEVVYIYTEPKYKHNKSVGPMFHELEIKDPRNVPLAQKTYFSQILCTTSFTFLLVSISPLPR